MDNNTSSEKEEILIHTGVLVIGGGFTGLKAAAEIAANGYSVTLVEKDEKLGGPRELITALGGFTERDNGIASLVHIVENDPGIEILTGSMLTGFSGSPGFFRAVIENSSGKTERTFGAVVAAACFHVEPLTQTYGITIPDHVLPQSAMEEILASPDLKERYFGGGNRTVSFLVGFGQEGNPLVMERVLRSVLAIENISGCAAFIYVNNLKVASDGLSQLYRDGRAKGAVYFKLREIPDISSDGEKIHISFRAPVLRQDIDVETDYLVVEETVCADHVNASLSKLLNINMGPSGFLQKNNVHRFPVHSNREGIYVVGSSRDVQYLSMAWTDAENVALEVKAFLGDGRKTVPKNRAVVDGDKCVTCLTCYRCCPHGAVSWDEKAVISPISCVGCGICASECPMDAIQIGGFSDTDIRLQIQKITASKNGDPLIVGFCCENSAMVAGESAAALKYEVPEGLKMIRVPCAGKIDMEYILNAFASGADGVMVMTCHRGNCKSDNGNVYAGWRVEEVHRRMSGLGIAPERLAILSLASNMGFDFAGAAVEMDRKLRSP